MGGGEYKRFWIYAILRTMNLSRSLYCTFSVYQSELSYTLLLKLFNGIVLQMSVPQNMLGNMHAIQGYSFLKNFMKNFKPAVKYRAYYSSTLTTTYPYLDSTFNKVSTFISPIPSSQFITTHTCSKCIMLTE